MKKISNYFILIILLIVIFLFIYNVQMFNNNTEDFDNGTVITQNYKYYRCNNKMLGTILKDIFDKNKEKVIERFIKFNTDNGKLLGGDLEDGGDF